MKGKIKTIDLFAGCGGLMEGFEQTGYYETLACVEWEKSPCDNLTERLSTKWGYKDAVRRVIRFDIQRTEELLNGWDDDEYGVGCGLNTIIGDNRVDVIIGGPPCQAYSLAGRVRDENGMKDDYRNYLFESYLKVVSHYKPKLFIFENVPGMLSAAPDGTPIVDRIKSSFDKENYVMIDDLNNAIIDMSEFGIPQNRKRVIILGVNKEYYKDKSNEILNAFYCEILPSLKEKKKTVREAIGDLPKLFPTKKVYRKNGRRYSHTQPQINVENHLPRFHNERDISIFRMLAEDIENGINKYINIEELKKLYTKMTGKRSNVHKYYVLRWDEQSNTIPAHLFKDGLRHIHPDPSQARSLTVREAARLQTFDDDYVFVGSTTHQYKMIGNAVPPMFSNKLANAIYILINRFG